MPDAVSRACLPAAMWQLRVRGSSQTDGKLEDRMNTDKSWLTPARPVSQTVCKTKARNDAHRVALHKRSNVHRSRTSVNL